jgi:hypothetical protein
MREKGGDLLLAHFEWMPLFVKENKAPDPVEISFLGANGVALDAQMPAHTIEQAWSVGGRWWRGGSGHGKRQKI